MATIRAWLGCWSVKKNWRALVQHEPGTFYLINGLRFFGLLWILLAHTVFAYGIYNGKEAFFLGLEEAPFYLWWLWNSGKAVDLFFVVSGFLISLILIKELDRSGDIKLGRFYFRRYLRLTPVYAFIALIFWLAGARNHEYIWTNLLYINNFLPPDKMALQWTWTLAVEEQFYLLLPPILMFVFRRQPGAFMHWMLGLLGLSLLIRFGVMYYFDELWNNGYREMLTGDSTHLIFYGKLYDNLATRFGPLILGVMAGHTYYYHREKLVAWVKAVPGRALWLNVLAMATLVFFMYFPILEQRFEGSSSGLIAYIVVHRTLFAAAFTWFMLASFLNVNHFQWLARFYAIRWWHPLGQLTYSMYLTHFIFIIVVVKQCNAYFHQAGYLGMEHMLITVLVSGAISLLLTLLMAVFCWLFIEKPFLNIRDLVKVSQGATKATQGSTAHHQGR